MYVEFIPGLKAVELMLVVACTEWGDFVEWVEKTLGLMRYYSASRLGDANPVDDFNIIRQFELKAGEIDCALLLGVRSV